MRDVRNAGATLVGLVALATILFGPEAAMAWKCYDNASDPACCANPGDCNLPGQPPDLGCVQCHDFMARLPAPVNDDLHNVHRNDMMNRQCNLCHSGTSRTPVFTWRSTGLTGVPNSNLSCAGCHGLDQGELGPDGLPKSSARGLRLHHTTRNPNPVTVCNNCHSDPAPARENILPVFYALTQVILKDPCNVDLLEDYRLCGNPPRANPCPAEGLDNDGDWLYDGADPDCGTAVCTATAAASPASAVLCEGDTLTLSDASSTATCPSGPLVYEWWQGPAGAPGSVLLGTGTSFTLPGGLAPGAYVYDLLVYCGDQTSCRDTLDNPIAVQVNALPGVVYPIKAVKQPNFLDQRFEWTAIVDAGLYRVYSVPNPVQWPPRGSNTAASIACATFDGLTTSCVHAGAIQTPPTLLLYQAVAVCDGNPNSEGPN